MIGDASQNLATPLSPGQNFLIADFFYSIQGDETLHGHHWMLRSILWQLLSQMPSFVTDFIQFYEQKILRHGPVTRDRPC